MKGHKGRASRTPLSFTPAVAAWVAERGFSPESGARGLRGVIQTEIEARLAEWLLGAASRRRGMIRLSIRGGKPCFRWRD